MRFMKEKWHRRSKIKRQKRAENQGFSLIETVVAMLVSMVVGLGAVALFSFSYNNNSGASERAMAVAIAQQRIERLRAVSTGDASLAATDANGRLETVSIGNRDFNVRTFVTGTDFRTITVTVAPRARGPRWAQGPVVFVTQRSAKL